MARESNVLAQPDRTFLNGNPKASLLPFSPRGIALKINGVARVGGLPDEIT